MRCPKEAWLFQSAEPAQRHAVKENGDCASWCVACRLDHEHRLDGLRATLQARKENTRRAEEELKLAEEIESKAQREYDNAVDERQEGI